MTLQNGTVIGVTQADLAQLFEINPIAHAQAQNIALHREMAVLKAKLDKTEKALAKAERALEKVK